MIIKIPVIVGVPFNPETDKSIEIESNDIVRFRGMLENSIVEMADGHFFQVTDVETNRKILLNNFIIRNDVRLLNED